MDSILIRPSGGRPDPETGPRSGKRRKVTAAILAAAISFGLVAAGGCSSAASTVSPPGTTPTPTSIPTRTASPSPTASPSTSSKITAHPTPSATAVPLPALLAAIGDSYTQAWSVSPSHRLDHPQYSWAIGTDKNDGVLSLLERFRSLGASPVVVDAATSGKKMDDAQRQAGLVVAAARKLAPGQTAYVTFELGTNDLCQSPYPMTDPAAFQTQLQTAVATLKAGLPEGSRILMVSVPDFPHFHDITDAEPAAKAKLGAPPADQCAPYLGTNGPADRTAADGILARYDASLKTACADINANPGPTGRLYCTYNAALLSDSDFTVKDLSTYDYFHPSLSGQAKMAADAWKADIWASSRLP